MHPTDEQTAAADAFRAGDHLALQAGAGTGKTSTLVLLASTTRRRGRYIAFNKAIAQHAATRFPPTVACKTAHSLAFAAVGHRYARRLNGPRQAGWKTGMALGITKAVRIGEREVTHKALSHAVLRTVTRYCHSADRTLTPCHVPQLRGLEDPRLHTQLTQTVLPFARKAWADLQHPEDGVVRFDHDHYLKIWALSDPKIDADFLLLDEAQDTNPVLEQVLTAQRAHAQLVMVGDSAQAIYGWRGARDIMAGFDGHTLPLSRSFRFGPALASEANRWLTIADAPIRLTGSDTIPTELAPVERPDAVLCRTNIGAITEVMAHLAAGYQVALAGGGRSLYTLATAARDLKSGRPTTHPELILFSSWGELQDYADHDPAGGDLKPFIDLIDQHGPDALLHAVERLAPDVHADVIISTAHRAKGCEWQTVRISGDFTPPKNTKEQDANGGPVPGPINDAEARLAYVAVTRARGRLDRGGLSWIDDHPAGNQEQRPPTL
ncbi:UvrD-helicase domain-containing protein [Streptomyces sp. AM8-1-1]|uniref:UvrD-helicase domain-containing protein n=1 Tax=Streptomyces sp. AM8-1-1 TaxID=3075825 RepID=UPI0028C50D4F|nr:UvrD-helicase domain-containing protein [Streptomyces sp. AM8-1-1]WNO77000.1 UvrD-helicase domain-containing protein [Streptomyces sp. AM8-1-1]WNO77418.1 UvrD-helicase domain-containing protein [Streptomyces sp. AM8-1-1]